MGVWLPGLRRTFCVALLLAVLPSGGCKDKRGDPAGPGTGPLDGDGLFGTAVVSSGVFRMHNHFAEVTLDLLESGASLPVFENGCQGNGLATITDANDNLPNTFAIRFSNYVTECARGIPLTFNTDSTANAAMVIVFTETAPGLQYDIFHPYDLSTNAPAGASVQLPSDQGGFILSLSTPFGGLHHQLDVPRGQAGSVQVSGTLRFEDRSQPLLVVEEESVTFAFDEDVDPHFAEWPGGTYEIAGFAGGGGFGFGGGTPGFPTDVFFDGFGGAAFEVENHQCVADMTDLEHGNPCEF